MTSPHNILDLFQRQIGLAGFGLKAQLKLRRSKVAIVGVGGLGCSAALQLYRAGVGHITLVDHDHVAVNNLHRQILFGESCIGVSKAVSAKQTLTDFPSDATIEALEVRLDSSNARSIVADHHVVIDCLDNLGARIALSDACAREKIPLVYGAVYQWEGRVGVFCGDNMPCYRCFHPEDLANTTCDTCSDSGVVGVVPATVGQLQALEAIKLLGDIGSTFAGRLHVIDFLQTKTFEWTISPQLPCCGEHVDHQTVRANRRHAQKFGEVKSISPTSLKEWLDHKVPIHLIDIRTAEERAKGMIPEAQPFDLALLDIPPTDGQTAVIYCASGVRSERICQQLIELIPHLNLYHLVGGFNLWTKIDAETAGSECQQWSSLAPSQDRFVDPN